MKMSDDLFKRYVIDPNGMDSEVRRLMKIPEDKYYSVSVWPSEVSGRITITTKIHRMVTAKKISKSDQSS